MEKDRKDFEWLKKLREMDKSNWLILGLVGILLLVIAIPVDKKKETKDDAYEVHSTGKEENSANAKETTKDYKEELEEELADMLENMEGVGRVKVMITLKDATSVISTACSKGVYHKNNAARKVSRLSKLVNGVA